MSFAAIFSAVSNAAKPVVAWATKSSPVIMGSLAIVTGAIALVETARHAPAAKERLDQARRAKAKQMVEEAVNKVKKIEAAETKEEAASESQVKSDNGNAVPEKHEVVDIDISTVKLTPMEFVKTVAPALWKPAVWALVSAGCMVASVWFGARQTMTAAAAATTAQTMLQDRINAEKAVLGDKKSASLTDAVHAKRAEKAVAATQAEGDIFDTGKGKTLLVETTFTGRPFWGDLEAVKAAVNDLNSTIVQGESVSVNDYLDHIGLSMTKDGERRIFFTKPETRGLIKIEHTAVEVTMPNGEIRPAIAVYVDNETCDIDDFDVY